jgi:hypothetical protein
LPKFFNNGQASKETTTTTVSQPPEPIKNNQPDATATTPVVVSSEMKAVIDANTEDIFVDTSEQLAKDYPTELVPLYAVSSVSESNQITNADGKPGWNTSYVSDLTTDEILTFYRSLFSGATDFSETTESSSTQLKATVSGYGISVSVSPNIPEKTDIPGNSAVSLFIEQR